MECASCCIIFYKGHQSSIINLSILYDNMDKLEDNSRSKRKHFWKLSLNHKIHGIIPVIHLRAILLSEYVRFITLFLHVNKKFIDWG